MTYIFFCLSDKKTEVIMISRSLSFSLLWAVLTLWCAHGQDLTRDYCESMNPDFVAEPMKIPAPFSITVSSDKYKAGQTLYGESGIWQVKNI